MTRYAPLHPSIMTIRSVSPFKNPGGPELIRDAVRELHFADTGSAEDQLLHELQLGEGRAQDRFLVALMHLAGLQGHLREDTIDELNARCLNDALADTTRRAAVYALGALPTYNLEHTTWTRIESALMHVVLSSDANQASTTAQAANTHLEYLGRVRRVCLALETDQIVIPMTVLNDFVDETTGGRSELRMLGYTLETVQFLRLALAMATNTIKHRVREMTRIGNTAETDIVGLSGYHAMIRTTWSIERIPNNTGEHRFLLTKTEFLFQL